MRTDPFLVLRDEDGRLLLPLRYEGTTSLWPVLEVGGCVFADIRTQGKFDENAVRGLVPPSWVKKARQSDIQGFVKVRHSGEGGKCPRYNLPPPHMVPPRFRHLPEAVVRIAVMFNGTIVEDQRS